MIDKKNITGIVLAGGKSSRMGSDKGLLKMNGKTFVEHVIEAMKPLVDEIVIVSNNPEYDQFGFYRVEDDIKDSGPLAGLYSGLKHSKTNYNLVLSCDIPMIKTEILKKLVEADYENYEVTQVESHNKTMPLIAIYQKQCMHKCLELLQQGERRLRVAVNQLKTKTISIDSELDPFVKNVNTKEDLKTINHAIEH
ncbi:MAG: molybdenum cofactor guanylyltransferase [Flavobacteriaceae bacterium]|nr:molybdenum cofactor guanylyltransferase [Flavobacteriaceae bacterium]